VKELSIKDLRELLAEGRFEDLIGVVESDVFDVKKQPYVVTTNKGKSDLAMDVAAFANAKGGMIVIGADAPGNKDVSHDPVIGLSPFPLELLQVQTYMNLLREWLYPMPTGVEVRTYPVGGEGSKGYAAIFIEPQAKEHLPILVARSLVDDSQNRTSRTLVGYALRRGPGNESFEVKDFHSMFKRGLEAGSWIAEELREMRLALGKLSLAPVDEQKKMEVVDATLATLRESIKLEDKRTLGMAIVPDERISIKTILNDGNDGAKYLMLNPMPYRPYGWDLGRLEVRTGPGYVQGSDSRWKVLRVTKDGSLFVAASLEKNYLAHASPEEAHFINPTSLIELIAHISDFYQKALGDALFSGVTVYIRLQGLLPFGESATGLRPYTNDVGWRFDAKLAEKDDLATAFSVSGYPAQESMQGRLAYLIIEQVYELFGLGTDTIPYITGEGTERRIDIEAIKAIK